VEVVGDTGPIAGPIAQPPLDVGDDQRRDQAADAPSVDRQDPEAIGWWLGQGTNLPRPLRPRGPGPAAGSARPGRGPEAAPGGCDRLYDREVSSVSELIEIRGGSFLMGSADFYPEEGPVREVEVADFAIERGPVTVAQFERFVAATGYVTLAEREPAAADYPDADPRLLHPGSAVFHPTPVPVPLDDPARWWSYVPGASWRRPWGRKSDNSGRGDHPVNHVGWGDARAYASWAGRELPSEVEWEYAARGGLDGAAYAWGDVERPGGGLMANHFQGEFPWRNTGAKGWRGTTPVGLFPANGYGLLDVTGNVWEWTADRYEAPERPVGISSPCCGPSRPGPQTGVVEARVVKGGSHLCSPDYCLRYRPAARQPETIDTTTSHIGFRCIVR
jgi:formylglycine-generating enzyme required for sulfatase activity